MLRTAFHLGRCTPPKEELFLTFPWLRNEHPAVLTDEQYNYCETLCQPPETAVCDGLQPASAVENARDRWNQVD
jgi:hypothetical protein